MVEINFKVDFISSILKINYLDQINFIIIKEVIMVIIPIILIVLIIKQINSSFITSFEDFS